MHVWEYLYCIPPHSASCPSARLVSAAVGERKTPPAEFAKGETTTCASRGGGVCVCVCVSVWCGVCGVIHVGGGGSVKVARKQLRKEKIGRTNSSQYNLSTWARRGLLLRFLSDAVIGNCQPPMSLKTWPPKLQRNISERQSLQSAQVFTRVLATDVFFSDLHCVVVVFLYINIMLL